MNDRAGVAGFFEDLPVLMFVLVGVSVLVLSAAWVARENAERQAEESLDEAARRIAGNLIASFLTEPGSMPRVSSLEGRNLSEAVTRIMPAAVSGFSVAVSQLYPGPVAINAQMYGDEAEGSRTGFARAVFNGVDDHGLVLVLEVRIIVW